MKIITLSIILFYNFICIGQKTNFKPITRPIQSFDIKVKNDKGITVYKYKNNLKLLNGLYNISIYYKDLSLGDAEFIQDDIKIRTLKYDLENKNYINTHTTEKGYFNNGYKTGQWKTTYNNKLVKTAHWNNGLITGLYTVKTTKGVLLYNTNFGPKGNGKFKDYYYKTGVLKQEGDYQNGKKEGEWCNYNTQGELTTTVHYKQGVIVK